MISIPSEFYFPKLIGGSKDNVFLLQVDYCAATDGLVAAGENWDPDLTRGIYPRSPIIIYYSGTWKKIEWAKVIDLEGYLVNVKLSDNGNYIIAKSIFVEYFLFSKTGNIIEAFNIT